MSMCIFYLCMLNACLSMLVCVRTLLISSVLYSAEKSYNSMC